MSSKDDDARDDNFRLNPEIFRGFPPLPDLSHVEVIFVQPAPRLARWTEGLSIHVVGAALVALAFFIGGLIGATNKAGISKESASCAVMTAPAPKKSLCVP